MRSLQIYTKQAREHYYRYTQFFWSGFGERARISGAWDDREYIGHDIAVDQSLEKLFIGMQIWFYVDILMHICKQLIIAGLVSRKYIWRWRCI